MPSVPDPTSVKPWYLRNITEALALDTVSGNVYVRTNAEITGNVTIPGSVDAHISEFGNIDITGSTLPATVYQGTDPWKVTGNITIDPGQTVEVTQGTSPWTISGTVEAIDTVGSTDYYGDTVVVGAPLQSDNGLSNVGFSYVYNRITQTFEAV